MATLKHDNSATKPARTHNPSLYEYTVSLSERQTFTGGSETTYEESDTKFTRSVGANVETVNDIVVTEVDAGALDFGYQIESKNPEVATFSSEGRATYVSDGSAKVFVKTPYYKQRIESPASYETGAVGVAPVGGFVNTSLAKALNDEVNAMLVGLTNAATNCPLFTTVSDTAPVRNANSMLTLAGVDVTAIGFSKTASVQAGSRRGCVLIAPQYGLQAHHWPSSEDVYVAADNTPHARTVTDSRRIGSTDLRIVKYASALPGSITPMKLAGSDADPRYPTRVGSGLRSAPCLRRNQQGLVYIMGLSTFDFDASYFLTGSPFEDGQLDYHASTANGDSSSPNMLLLDGELVLLGAQLSFFTGPCVSHYLTEIQTAITDMGGGTSYTTKSFASYVDYTNLNLLPTSGTLSSWTKTGTINLTTGQESPDGNSTGVLVASASTGAFNNIYGPFNDAAINNTNACASVYLKAGSSTNATVLMWNNTHASLKQRARCDINLTTGSYTAAYGTVSVVDRGDGWWQVIAYAVPRTNSTDVLRLIIYPNTAGSVASGNNILVWHPQVNLGTISPGYEGT